MTDAKTETPRSDKVAMDLPAGDSLGAIIMSLQLARTLERENAALRSALQGRVWVYRSDFPDDPFCALCGAGRAWAEKHGHQGDCPLFEARACLAAISQTEG